VHKAADLFFRQAFFSGNKELGEIRWTAKGGSVFGGMPNELMSLKMRNGWIFTLNINGKRSFMTKTSRC
jgi:hypothetical protein